MLKVLYQDMLDLKLSIKGMKIKVVVKVIDNKRFEELFYIVL